MQKLKRFQRKGTRSSRMRLPGLGAFGRIRPAGMSRSSARQAKKVAPTLHASAATSEIPAISGEKSYSSHGAKL